MLSPSSAADSEMLKLTLKNPALRKRARQFGRLVRHSVVTPRTGSVHKPKLVDARRAGRLTFIGHSSFFVQIGGQNVVIDPNFARWLFVSETPAAAGGPACAIFRPSTWCW